MPIFHVHKNYNDQAGVATSTWTKVTWVTEVYDTHGGFDLPNNRFLPQVAGKYLLIQALRINGVVMDKRILSALHKNGVLHVYMGQIHASHTMNLQAMGSAIVEANGSTDYFELFGFHDSGVNKVISGHIASTLFFGFRIIEDS